MSRDARCRHKVARAPCQGNATSGPRALPTLHRVEKFPKTRLKEGNSVRVISFHLGSRGNSSLDMVSPAKLSHRLHPALAVPKDGKRQEV